MTHTFGIAVVDTHVHEKSALSVEATLACVAQIPLHISKLYWISDQPFHKQVVVPVCNHIIPKITKFPQEYNHIMLHMLPDIIEEDFVFVIQWDGFAVNPLAWSHEFLDYDYVGAVWPCWEGVGHNRVGNGGFSLRSRKLLKALPHVNFSLHMNEDESICRAHRAQLEQVYGIKFCPEYLAHRFSVEQVMDTVWTGKSLGFHGTHGIAAWYNVSL